jgi:hypothetical protein
MKFKIDYKGNERLKKIVEKVEASEELNTLWQCCNVMAIDRLNYSDHGPIHVKLVAHRALKLLRLLDVELPGIEKNYNFDKDYSEVVVFLASVLHDIGMIAQRKNHESFGVGIAYHILNDLLSDYPEKEKFILISEILHAIISHQKENKTLTKEAGVVKIADALDMEKGRARIPFDIGEVNIHSVSALAIDKIDILKGRGKPILIKIYMSNSAGIFQVDELLKNKIKNSGLENYIEVIAEIKGETEKKIIREFKL